MEPVAPTLAESFLGRRPSPPALDKDALEAALEARLTAARAAWPGVTLAPQDFATALAERAEPERDALEAIDALHCNDVYLAVACAAHEPVALEHFERDCVALLPAILSTIVAHGAAMEEARQLVRQRLLVGDDGPPRIAGYSGRGPLRGWFRAAALRLALNLQRAQRARPFEVELGDHASPVAVDAEASLARARHRDDFQSSLREALRGLTSQQRMLMRWHFFEGLPLSRIAELEGVSKATVSRWLSAARQEVLTHTRAELAHRLRVPKSEISSLIDVLLKGANATLADLLSRTHGK